MDLPQAYFLLESLKTHIPASYGVDPKWVGDYHKILDAIEKETNIDLSDFRIQQEDSYHPVTSVRLATRRAPGQVRRGSSVMVERARLLHKLDAVLSYFQFSGGSASAAKQSIGFKQP
jgi:hypothetical protein